MHLLHALVQRGHHVTALYPKEHLSSPGLGIPGVHEANFYLDTFSTNPLNDYRSLTSLRSVIRTLAPTHVLSFTIKPVVYGSLAAALERVPFIYSLITGLGYLFTGHSPRRALLRRYAEFLYTRALARNKKIFFQNADDLELFNRRHIVSLEQGTIIPGSGVDTAIFTPSPSTSHIPTFSFIGRLLWDKGLGDFAAASALLQREESVRMVVAGAASNNPASVPNNILKGWISKELIDYRGHMTDVLPLLHESWAVVLPSHREGCSRAIQEALAAGKPVITTDAPGCRDSIEHGTHGLVVPAHDPKALAEAIAYLSRSPSLRHKMGRSARQHALARYDQDLITSSLIQSMGL